MILLLVMLLSYAMHARGEYDDLDRTLVVSAGHAAAEASIAPYEPHLVQGRSDLEIALRPVASCWKVPLVPRHSLLSNRVSCFGHQRDLLSTLSSRSCHPLCHLQSFVILIALSGC